MKSKASVITGLWLAMVSIHFAHAEQGSQTLLPFHSQEELYHAIKKFSKEELGMPLILKEPVHKDGGKKAQITHREKWHFIKRSPRLGFWADSTSLCSLYVYWSDVFPSVKEKYDTEKYDIHSYSLEPYQFAAGDKQTVPSIDVTKDFYSVVRKIESIFHEGFHYHVQRKVPGLRKKGCLTLIKERSLEEAAATVIAERARSIFIRRYAIDNNNTSIKWYTSESSFKGSRFDEYNVLYDSLAIIYASDLPDSVKLAKKGNVNNATLSAQFIYSRYYRDFEKLWNDTDNPKKGIKLFLQILKGDIDQPGRAREERESIEY